MNGFLKELPGLVKEVGGGGEYCDELYIVSGGNRTTVMRASGRISLRRFRMEKGVIFSGIADMSLKMMKLLSSFDDAAGLVMLVAGLEGLETFLNTTLA